MTASETIRTAAALMRVQHGPCCPDQVFWGETANLLDVEADGAEQVEALLGGIGARALRPLKVARAYLATQPAPEVTR